jgi:flagellar M-ring protein FliF
VIRSKQTGSDQSNKSNTPAANVSSVNPLTGGGTTPAGSSESNQHQDETVNYEISKTVRVTQNPVGALTKLSVAAVLDGTYKMEKNDKGVDVKTFVPRTPEEMTRFETIVKQAMGYSADREDQLSVESIPFSSGDVWEKNGEGAPGFSWDDFKKEYGRPIVNILLIILLFFFVVRPLVKTFKQVSSEDEEDPLLKQEVGKLTYDDQGRPVLPRPKAVPVHEKAMIMAREDINRSANIIKGWLSEGEE